MNAREKAEALRQEAIAELLAERRAIDEQLSVLGYESLHGDPHPKVPTRTRRGRPPKSAPSNSPLLPPGDHDPTLVVSA